MAATKTKAKPSGKKKDKAPAKTKAKSDAKAQAEVRRLSDDDLRLAHEATALAKHGRFDPKTGEVTFDGPEVPFGANVTSVQVRAMRDAIKGKDILKALGCDEAHLFTFARDRSHGKDLPAETKLALRELNKEFPPKMKMWARKDAVILFVLLKRERQKVAYEKQAFLGDLTYKRPEPAPAPKKAKESKPKGNGKVTGKAKKDLVERGRKEVAKKGKAKSKSKAKTPKTTSGEYSGPTK